MSTLLVIDDEEKWVNQIEQWFAPKHYQVIKASSGEDGVAKALECNPDVIILDLVLSSSSEKMQGEDVILELTHNQTMASIPIIVFSFLGDDPLRRINLARQDILSVIVKAKKYKLAELEAVVESLIRRRPALASDLKPDTIQCEGSELKLGRSCTEVWVKHPNSDLRKHTIPPLPAKVLAHLNEYRGQHRTVPQIDQAVYEDQVADGDVFRVRRLIERLREIIEQDPKRPKFICTQKGYGYVLVEGDHSSSQQANAGNTDK